MADTIPKPTATDKAEPDSAAKSDSATKSADATKSDSEKPRVISSQVFNDFAAI